MENKLFESLLQDSNNQAQQLFESKKFDDKIEIAYDKMDKYMPDDFELQEEYYSIIKTGKVKDLKEFIEIYAHEDVLGKYMKTNDKNYTALAEYMIKMNSVDSLNESFNFEKLLQNSNNEFTQLFESTKFNLDQYIITVDSIDYDKSFDTVNFNIYLKNKLDGVSTIYHILYNFDDKNLYINFDEDVVEMLQEEGEDTKYLSYDSQSSNIKKYPVEFKFIVDKFDTILRRNNIKSIY